MIDARVRSRAGPIDLEVDTARVAAGIREGQLRETIKLLPLSFFMHGIAAPAVVAVFWNSAPRAGLVAIVVAIVLISACAFANTWRYIMRRGDERAVSLAIRFSYVVATLAGSVWGLAALWLYGPADQVHRTIFVAVIVGVMSGGFALGSILAVAICYLTPLMLLSLITVLGSDTQVGFVLAGLLALYSTFVMVSVWRMDVLAIRRSRARLQIEQQNATIGLLLRDFEAEGSAWLWETDAAFRLRNVSPRFAQAAGRTLAMLENTGLVALVGSKAASAKMLVSIVGARAPFADVLVSIDSGDQERWWHLTGKPILGRDGQFLGYRGSASDVTIARASSAEIARLAATDPLTGLANRSSFRKALERAIADHRAHDTSDGTVVALFYADLDNFKEVNDQLGHHAGDQLLVQAAERVAACMPVGAVVARIGGDEFGVMLCGLTLAQVKQAAGVLVETIESSYVIDGMSIPIGIGVGIACFPDDADDPSTLLRHADLALYETKATGASGYSFYDQVLGAEAIERLALRNDLRAALDQGQFHIAYQPIVDLGTGLIAGCEALLRWHHPVRGVVVPERFIPMAEALGLIVPVGAWVLREACQEAAGWPSDMRIAVNLSPVQFRNGDLLRRVLDATGSSGLSPHRLELEITESALLDATRPTIDMLNAMRKLGVRVALDDFGTGYASLSYLLTFPFDKIKIDRSFIRDIATRDDCAAIVDAVIGLAHRIGVEVTAEGVEQAEQVRTLRGKGCDQIQGFLIDAPRPAADIRAVIAAWTPLDIPGP